MDNNNNGQNYNNSNNFVNSFTNTSDYTQNFDPDDINRNKVICAISYVSILFFLPLVACPNSRFGKFHANQSLLLLIFSAAVNLSMWFITLIINLIPFIGIFLSFPLKILIGLLTFAFMVTGIVNAANGKAKELPWIGHIRLLK